MCVYRVVKGTIQHSPLTSFIFSKILILFLLRKSHPIPVAEGRPAECVHVLAWPVPVPAPQLAPAASSCIRRERASSTSSPCLLLHPRTTATHKYLSLIFGFLWILAFTTKVLNKKQIFNTFFPTLPESHCSIWLLSLPPACPSCPLPPSSLLCRTEREEQREQQRKVHQRCHPHRDQVQVQVSEKTPNNVS